MKIIGTWSENETRAWESEKETIIWRRKSSQWKNYSRRGTGLEWETEREREEEASALGWPGAQGARLEIRVPDLPGILRMTEFSSIDSPTCCHLHRWRHAGHYLQQRTAPDWACAERQIRPHSNREIHPECLQRFAVPSRGMPLRRLRPSWRTSQWTLGHSRRQTALPLRKLHHAANRDRSCCRSERWQYSGWSDCGHR